ncbi:TRAP transporter large permease subunit [Azospirillum brasilense]|uniref:TRAP transporter large permease subunit n=1 Tax=Azospirillum brasilense TaxID=192 RepID=UPI0023EC14D4|nr:TRAP transporter large permease subunit [Azospirillum brasilense]
MASTILICTPIFLPIAMQYGMDPVQFGIVMLINCALGLNTPPVGTTQFIGCAIGEISVGQVMRSILPFYGALFVTLLLVTYVPAFSLWLPGRVPTAVEDLAGVDFGNGAHGGVWTLIGEWIFRGKWSRRSPHPSRCAGPFPPPLGGRGSSSPPLRSGGGSGWGRVLRCSDSSQCAPWKVRLMTSICCSRVSLMKFTA